MLGFMRAVTALVLLSLVLSLPKDARAQYVDPGLRWRTFDTEHFSVHFADRHRPLANAAAQVAEDAYPRITGWLQWQPQSRVHLLVLDSADYSNGYATPLPFNEFAIYLSPPDEGELLQNRGWLEMVITHELTHIVHMDKARRLPLVFRSIFGRVPLPFPSTLPNVWGPAWIKEGLAVYSESDMAAGYGRLGQSTFEGMMRAEAARGLRSLREIHADGRGFPLNRDYLYGSYFYLFLAERYGPQAITAFIEAYSDDFIPFRVHTSTYAATGKTMDVLWTEYQDWLNARFRRPPAAGDSAGDALLQSFSVTSPAIAADGTRWYVLQDGYTRPRLVEQAAGGEPRVVREVEPGTRVVVTAERRPLIAQPEICGNYNYYYDLWRGGTGFLGTWERLTSCSRLRFVAPLVDGRIVGLRVVEGRGEVVMLGADGAEERTLYAAIPGEMITGVAARDASVVLTSWRSGRWTLLEVGNGQPVELVADAAVKHSPRFGDSAEEIFFVADYGKVYNLWSLRREGRRLSRWTQAPYGVQEASAPVGGEVLLTTIEADGDILRIHKLPAAPLERRDGAVSAQLAPETAPEPPTAAIPDRTYWPFASMLPRWWFPQLLVADGMVGYGVITSGSDALGLHEYTLAPLIETSQREFLGAAAYVYNGRHGLFFDRSMTVRANDPNDDKDSARQRITAYEISETAQWVSTWRHVKLNSSFYWGLGAALDRETLYQVDVSSTRGRDERVGALVAGYDSRRWQWYGEGPTQGQQLRLFAERSPAGQHGGQYSGNVYRGDWRVFFPLGKTVLSGRWNEVYGQRDAEPIELGDVFTEETYGYSLPILNQRDFPLRGYRRGDPGLTGHRARLGTLEYRVPLSDVDRAIMVPPGGVNRVSMNVFADVGAAWDTSDQRSYHRGYGVELLVEARAGYLYGAQLRAGVAHGVDEGGRTVGYLRIGRSF